jgi:hypothetical protein
MVDEYGDVSDRRRIVIAKARRSAAANSRREPARSMQDPIAFPTFGGRRNCFEEHGLGLLHEDHPVAP